MYQCLKILRRKISTCTVLSILQIAAVYLSLKCCIRLRMVTFEFNYNIHVLCRFTEPPVLDMRSVVDDSTTRSPLIFVLSPGVVRFQASCSVEVFAGHARDANTKSIILRNHSLVCDYAIGSSHDSGSGSYCVFFLALDPELRQPLECTKRPSASPLLLQANQIFTVLC